MGQWIDRVASHPVWDELRQLGPVLDKAAALPDLTAEAVDGLERLRYVLAFTGRRLAAADKTLVDPRILSSISTPLSSIRQLIESYAALPNVAHITSANVAADDIVTVLTNVLFADAPESLAWIGESTSQYRDAVEGHLRSIKEQHGQIQSVAEQNRVTLAALATELATERAKLASIVAEQQAQFAAAQTERATKFATTASEAQTSFSSSQNERQERFTASQTENLKSFSADQETRVKEFAASQAERAQAFSVVLAEYTQTLATHSAELQKLRDSGEATIGEALSTLKVRYEAEATEILETIQTRRSEVEKLVGVIGNLGVTSGYQKVANRAQYAVYFWQAMTVSALAGLIYVAYLIAFSPATTEALFYQGLSTRIFLSIAVGVFAAYAAKQAANNMITEAKSRRLALELEALGPFIAPLPTEMQDKFRAELGNRSFGVVDDAKHFIAEKDPVTAADLLPLLKDTLTELLKKVGK